MRAFDRWVAARVLGTLAGAPVQFELWDGTRMGSSQPVARVVIKDRRALVGLAWNPDLSFGEAFMAGRVDVEGDLVGLLEAISRAWLDVRRSRAVRLHRWLGRQAHTLRGSRANVHHHYDLGNEFYRLWLDEQMVYTCAYFATPDQPLEEAQVAKMDHVCRKLQIEPGETVVEAGCGWGALAMHMARRYGVSVRAFNISREQVRYAQARVRQEGLSDRVEIIEDDYRAISGQCDVFVSVGMLEHVGLDRYRALGEAIHRCVHPERGRGLLHFIGRNRPGPLNAWIRKRIFPGTYPPTLPQALGLVLEPRGFSVLDVENLRLHYARTLQHWLARFDASAAQVAAKLGDPFARAWRLYLAGSQAAFAAGTLQLFQITFARGRSNDIPWTRAHVYR